MGEKPSVIQQAKASAAPGTPTRRSDVDIATNDSDNEPAPHLHARTYLAVFAVALIYYAQLFNIVGAGAQTQTISSALGGSSSSVWISSPLAIGTVVLSPIVSQASDYWGRRWFMVILTILGAVGSIVVARANSMEMAIAGFSITGLSYGAQPLLHAVASEVLPRRYRSWAQAADLVSNALGGITALLVGGALNRDSNPRSESFRTYWYISTGIFALAAALTVLLYNPPPTERQKAYTFSEKLGKLDWIGYFLLTAGLVLFCVALSWSQNPYPWTSAQVSATFGVGLALLVLLGLYEGFIKKDGMFHHGLFQNRNFALIITCIFCEGVAFFAANQYFAFEVAVLYETDNLVVGVRYALAMFVSIFSAVICGLYCAVTKQIRAPIVLSFAIFVAFFAAMAVSGTENSKEVWGYPVLLGTALGLSLCALITGAQLSTPPDLIAITSGLVIAIRSLGGSVGLAIYNALFTDQMGHLGDNIAGAVVPKGLPPSSLGPFIGALTSHDTAALFQIPGVTPDIVGAGAGALLNTYASGFKHVWIAGSAFVAFAAIVAVFIKDPKKEFNMHIDAPVEASEVLYRKSNP